MVAMSGFYGIYINEAITVEQQNLEVLHELMHVSQFEEDYMMIRYKPETPQKAIKLLEKISDLVKDYDVELRIKQHLQYQHESENLKYEGYHKQLFNMYINHATINSYKIRILAIEIVYVWLLDNEERANELLELCNHLTERVSECVHKLIPLFDNYSVPCKLDHDTIIYEIIKLLSLSKYLCDA